MKIRSNEANYAKKKKKKVNESKVVNYEDGMRVRMVTRGLNNWLGAQ